MYVYIQGGKYNQSQPIVTKARNIVIAIYYYITGLIPGFYRSCFFLFIVFFSLFFGWIENHPSNYIPLNETVIVKDIKNSDENDTVCVMCFKHACRKTLLWKSCKILVLQLFKSEPQKSYHQPFLKWNSYSYKNVIKSKRIRILLSDDVIRLECSTVNVLFLSTARGHCYINWL